MTLFEILNFNRELLERLAGTGYKPDDYKYIDLYREYEQMRRKGDKVTYCVDDFNFLTDTARNITAMYKVIGNAVPVTLAYNIASAIMEQVFKKNGSEK